MDDRSAAKVGALDDIDCAVVGAGVVGLAVARALARSGFETVILEREGRIGCGASSRNSEVIHAGIYYAENSLKARLCVAGKDLIYEYCAGHHLAHAKCGKLIVATSADHIATLEALDRAARRNGVEDLVWLDADQARRLEPELVCAAALLSPSTGIIDSHDFMLSLLGEAEEAGAVLARATEVAAIVPEGRGAAIYLKDAAPPTLRARLVVNAAGLDAIAVARGIAGFPARHIPHQWLAKGSYFSLAGKSPFRRLIYPVPEAGGLGVHATIDLGGRARFGPDVEWIDRPDYAVDPRRSAGFYQAIRAYWPNLPDGGLAPAYAGIRPKLSGPGAPPADFRIDGPLVHGVPGIINLFGIESPGLTASLAIADAVAGLAKEALGA